MNTSNFFIVLMCLSDAVNSVYYCILLYIVVNGLRCHMTTLNFGVIIKVINGICSPFLFKKVTSWSMHKQWHTVRHWLECFPL